MTNLFLTMSEKFYILTNDVYNFLKETSENVTKRFKTCILKTTKH